MEKTKCVREAIRVTKWVQIFQDASFPKPKARVEVLMGLVQTQQKNWGRGLLPATPMISPVSPKFILIPSLPMIKKWVIIFYCTAPPNTPWFTAHPQKQIPSSAPCTPLLPLLSLLPHTQHSTHTSPPSSPPSLSSPTHTTQHHPRPPLFFFFFFRKRIV